MGSKQQTVTVAGRKLKLTNLEKVLYPEAVTTKAEVIEYFQTIAPVMLPHIRRRAVTRKRWPDGPGTTDDPKDAFFRKNLEDSAPAWVPRLGMQHSDHVNIYPLAEDEAVLAWFGQVAALELHVPQWRFDASVAPFIPQDQEGEPPVAERRNPDRLVLDLDPGAGTDVTDCAQVARWCREVLDDIGLPSVPVTSGSKGIHLYAALDGSYTSDQVSEVAKELARSLEADHPKEVVSQMKKTARKGKVFIDWSQNNANKTTVAPYSLRGRPQPWVAAPRTWEELKDPDLGQLTFQEVLERVAEGTDPLADFGRYTDPGEADSPAVAEPAPKKTQQKTKDIEDALTKYRSMRDAAKTPEPVPEDSPAAREGNPIFVIQEHHATALHYDTRLERDGVLVSWAVPKGPPLEVGGQGLAVQTEDHPIEYAEFEGTIPKNEYGGGEVFIWDSGTVEIEKWEKKKVVFVLHGQPEGGLGGVPRRYALVQTDEKGKNWLIRLMKDQPKQSAARKSPAKKSPTQGKADSKTTPYSRTAKDEPVSLPDPLPSPMLATMGAAKDLRGEDWIFEAKWDGYRILSAVHHPNEEDTPGAVELRSRNGKDYTTVFPELAELADLAPPGTVLDGEVVALNSSHRPDFGLLQRRGRLTKKREIDRAAERIPVHYMVFDVLHTAEHGDLTDRPYTERREILRELVASGKQVQVPEDLGDELDHAVEISEELKLEGILAKRAKSTYRAGKRSDEWIKIKHDNHADVVIIGWRQGKSGRAKTFGSLLLAIEDDDGELTYAGRVGTGFSDAELTEIRQQLETITRKTPPVHDVPREDASDATWVTPKIHAEVKHSGITRDHRLRHPTWRTVKPTDA
ncbi:ATP-dependent DNA ligase [Nesterenkonia sphaerica]|uniref:DNA ligase (ATP) n=1 Tax=Nesterenkonia sphaerica TaxID=1804988 RepID=A0A5R9A220_9MICC|nr:ATP-dependent DNA ligase [Nesterenkonia sphaerica]TLP71957.1 ATP-dependent DNA ligase [Nesterenkonia sphaerica]